jgi:hypothetical protein
MALRWNAIAHLGEKVSESGGKSEDQPFSEKMSEALDGRASDESRSYGIKTRGTVYSDSLSVQRMSSTCIII